MGRRIGKSPKKNRKSGSKITKKNKGGWPNFNIAAATKAAITGKTKPAPTGEPSKPQSYNANVVTEANKDDLRLTNKSSILSAKVADTLVTKEGAEVLKTVSSGLNTLAIAFKFAEGVPGAGQIAMCLKFAVAVLDASVEHMEFRALLYEVMTILTNLHKIFLLINRASDIFRIALHNPQGIVDLLTILENNNMLTQDSTTKELKNVEKLKVIAMAQSEILNNFLELKKDNIQVYLDISILLENLEKNKSGYSRYVGSNEKKKKEIEEQKRQLELSIPELATTYVKGTVEVEFKTFCESITTEYLLKLVK